MVKMPGKRWLTRVALFGVLAVLALTLLGISEKRGATTRRGAEPVRLARQLAQEVRVADRPGAQLLADTQPLWMLRVNRVR